MVVKQSSDDIGSTAAGKTISLERLSSASSSTLNNVEVNNTTTTTTAATNKKLFDSLLNGSARRRLVNSTLSLNEQQVTFELIKAASRKKTAASTAVTHGRQDGDDSCESGITQKSLPDLMNCSRSDAGSNKSSANHETSSSSTNEDQSSLNDDEEVGTSSLSAASETAQSTAEKSGGGDGGGATFESSSLSSSQESARYLSSDDSSAEDAAATSPSSRKSAVAADLMLTPNSNEDEDEDAIVFSSDMTVIIDRGAQFLNHNGDQELEDDDDEYSSRRETVTFTKIAFNSKEGSKSPSASSEPDNISTNSNDEKSLSNYLVNREEDDVDYSPKADRAAKLVNSISDENIEALNGEGVSNGYNGEPGSPETPPAFMKSRADSSLLTTTSCELSAPRALTKQSSFLSSGKSTISSAHSNSLACEVTSLSSMTSDYSQFEFLNNNNSNIHQNSSQNAAPTTTAAALPAIKPDMVTSTSSGSSGGLTSFFFSNGLFGSAKKQKQLMSSTLAASEDKSVKQLVVSSATPAPSTNSTVIPHESALSSRLDSFTNKLLNFKPSNNKNSFNVTTSASQVTPPPPPPPAASSSSNITKFFFSSNSKTPLAAKTSQDSGSSTSPAAAAVSSPTNGGQHAAEGSIKSNHSINNLSSVVQVPNSVLIFENRPSNLPAKSQQEALKHQREYDKMVEIAKKKEAKEKEMKLKKYEQQMRKEDFMANSLKIWNLEILANWAELKDARRTHQLWWHGLPPSIRGKVWRLAIGNELNLTKESYYHYERKAQEKLAILNKLNSNSPDLNEEEKRAMSASLDQERTHESSVELIKLDVSRTFPQLCFFQRDGPYHDALHGVLGAYACYNTKIGYVQGMSFLTAILLLNMEAPDAFICLSNLLNTRYLLACFCMNQTQMNRYFKAHQILLEHNLPKLYRHFEEQKVKPDLYLIEWIFTLFSKSLPLDVVSRVWDVFLRDHEEFLFRTALGILNLYKDTLLKMDFIHIVQFLTKLPENINSTQLFKSIEQISTTIDETYFTFNHLIGDI